jgi:hypothetical protein
MSLKRAKHFLAQAEGAGSTAYELDDNLAELEEAWDSLEGAKKGINTGKRKNPEVAKRLGAIEKSIELQMKRLTEIINEFD